MSGSPFRSPWSFNLAPQDTTWLAGWPAGSCSGEQVLMVSGESPHAVPACLSLQGLWKVAGALAQGGSTFYREGACIHLFSSDSVAPRSEPGNSTQVRSKCVPGILKSLGVLFRPPRSPALRHSSSHLHAQV